MVSIVRNQNTSAADVRGETEPPVDPFESGFLNAEDEELWKTLDALKRQESEMPGTSFIDRDMLFALDKMSESNGKSVGIF